MVKNMTDEHVPAIEIIKSMVEKIDIDIKIERVKYDFDKMEHKFLLSRGSRTCEVSLSRDFLDDLNDYTGSKESKYWIALEGTLKRRLSIPLQIAGLIPFSSAIFFEDNQDWEQDNGHNIEVYYSENDYEIFQEGLKDLYHYLEKQKTELSHLKLKTFPYAEEQQRIQTMLLHRNEQISKNGSCPFRDRISVTSRMHLKAAALMQLVFLEKEITQGKYSETVKKEIAAKISKILHLLSSHIFERIEVAECLHGIRKDMGDDESKVVVPDNPRKRQYDVVISFAGEDRDYAKKIAELLRGDDFSVFYDEHEEHALWGKNLYEHLTEVYSRLGKYCVMFLSRYYAAKQWPSLERKAAQARAFKEHEEYILPIRVDDTEIPGILDTVAYQDLREKSIEVIYEILKRKLLPGKEPTRIEAEADSIGQLGLSDDAINLLKLLSDKSERALSNDPMFTAQEVLDALKLSDEAISIAADELDERGFVKLHKTLGMGKAGFSYIGTTEILFSVTDKYLRDWDTEDDSVSLAQALISIAKEGHGVSIQEAADYLKWEPRRINPSLFLLIERDMVNPSKAINPNYIALHVILKPKIYRYIKNVKR
jgi:hypothetical protein